MFGRRATQSLGLNAVRATSPGRRPTGTRTGGGRSSVRSCNPSPAGRARGPDLAEVFSGASLQIGIWNPWTLLVTYWLYFAHFFFLTTLAVSTRRTSLWSLYLWGVL